MYSKLVLLLTLSIGLVFTSCKKEFTVENETMTGTMVHTNKSFTPLTFDSNGKPTTAKQVQALSGTVGKIGAISASVEVVVDLVTGISKDVPATYSDKDGNTIKTLSQAVLKGNELILSENIIGGTGTFAKITGSGSQLVKFDFATGIGNSTVEWTVTY